MKCPEHANPEGQEEGRPGSRGGGTEEATAEAAGLPSGVIKVSAN